MTAIKYGNKVHHNWSHLFETLELTTTLLLPRDQGLSLLQVYVYVHMYECEQMCAHNLVPWMEEYICASPYSFETKRL